MDLHIKWMKIRNNLHVMYPGDHIPLRTWNINALFTYMSQAAERQSKAVSTTPMVETKKIKK